MSEANEQRESDSGSKAIAAQQLPDDVKSFIDDIASNWDCDSDGHKYGTGCRMCAAHELMNKYDLSR